MEASTPEAQSERQTTLDLLTALTPQWLDLRFRYDRSAHFDSKLRAEYNEVNDHMNEQLESLHAQMLGEVALEGIDHAKIIEEDQAWVEYRKDIPAQGYAVPDGRA